MLGVLSPKRRLEPGGGPTLSGGVLDRDRAARRATCTGELRALVAIVLVTVATAAAQGSWVETVPAGAGPPARAEAAFAFDGFNGEALLFGGSASGAPLGDLWRYRGDLGGPRWVEVKLPDDPARRPRPRAGAAMVYDPGRRVVVLYGGRDAAGFIPETWELDVARWQWRTPPLVEPATEDASGKGGPAVLLYDREAHEVVRFRPGGRGAERYRDGRWAGATRTDGSAAAPAWPQPEDLLDARAGGVAAVLDTGRKRLVRFGGGSDLAAKPSDDTLERDAAGGWRQVSPGRRPPPRRGHAIAYDPGRKRVIVFGGSGARGDLADTWEYPERLGQGRFPSLTSTAPLAARTDNVTILLRRDRIEAGIRLATFDRWSGEPEFNQTGEGWCERCYFASDVGPLTPDGARPLAGGFEALRTRVSDPAYPVSWHAFEVDDAFTATPPAADVPACRTDGGERVPGFLARLTYWDGEAAVEVRTRSAQARAFGGERSYRWKTGAFCIHPSELSGAEGLPDLWIGTSGTGRDVYFRELTLFASDPDAPALEYPEGDLLDFDYVARRLTPLTDDECDWAGDAPDPLLDGHLRRYDHAPLRDRDPRRALVPELSDPRPGGAVVRIPWIDDLPGTGCHVPGPPGGQSCIGDAVARAAPAIDPSPQGLFVGVMGDRCPDPGPDPVQDFELWDVRPFDERDPGDAILTLEYWDEPAGVRLLMWRQQTKARQEPAHAFATAGTPAWKTQSIVFNTRGFPPEHPLVLPRLEKPQAGGASAAGWLKVRRLTVSRTRVETELASGGEVGSPVPGWVRVRRASGTLATHLAGPHVAVALAGSSEPEGAEPAPVLSFTPCVLHAGSCEVAMTASGPALVSADAVLRFRPPGASEGGPEFVVRSVPWDWTVVTARPAIPDIHAIATAGGALAINGVPETHSGWTVAIRQPRLSNRTLTNPLPTQDARLPSLYMEATPGDWDARAGAFAGAGVLASRIWPASASANALERPSAGTPLESAPTRRQTIDDLWSIGRQLHAYHLRGIPIVLATPIDRQPLWFVKDHACGVEVVGDEPKRELPCPPVSDGRNVFSQVRSRDRSPRLIANPQACFASRAACVYDDAGRKGTGKACWNDPAFRAATRTSMERLLMAIGSDETLAKTTLAVEVLNEPSFGWYAPRDVCYCEDCLWEWWHWLERRYPTLADLNCEYGTAYGGYWEVEPPALDNTLCSDGCSKEQCAASPLPAGCRPDSDHGCTGDNPSLCRDWMFFRTDTMLRFVRDMAGVWQGHLRDRYPYADRVPELQAPLTTSAIGFDHWPMQGWVWPRNWEELGRIPGLATLGGNNILPGKSSSLEAIMRDKWAPDRPYLQFEMKNFLGDDGCESDANKAARYREAGADLLLGGESALVWLERFAPGVDIPGSSLASFRASPVWQAANRISRWYGRLAGENQARSASRTGPGGSGSPAIAVLVSDSSVARLFAEDRNFLYCGTGQTSEHRLFDAGLTALHTALYNLAGYEYTYLTERELLDDPSLLASFRAVILAGFHGDDLERSFIYSYCRDGAGDPCLAGRRERRCLVEVLEPWVKDGGILIGAWRRPLEAGRVEDHTLRGPLWGLDRLAGVSYRDGDAGDPPTLANFAQLYQWNPAVRDPGCPAAGLCWEDLRTGSFPCMAWEERRSSCVAPAGPAPPADVLISPTRWGCGGSLHCGDTAVPAGVTRHRYGAGSVYLRLDGFEVLGLVPTNGSCQPLIRGSYTARLLALILGAGGVWPTVDTHAAVSPSRSHRGCLDDVREPWKNFAAYGDAGCRAAVLSLYNPYGAIAPCTGCRACVLDGDEICQGADWTCGNVPKTSRDVAIRGLTPGMPYRLTLDDGDAVSELGTVSADGEGRIVLGEKSCVSLPPGALMVVKAEPLRCAPR